MQYSVLLCLMEKFYTPQEIADQLQVSKRTVLKWIDEGKIAPVLREGPKIIRISKGSLENFINSDKKEPR